MAVRYPDHAARTRTQAAWMCTVLLLTLMPLAIWRAASQPFLVGTALVMVTAAPFIGAYQCWRFLEEQERVHEEPTPEMRFVFRFLANTPLTIGVFLLFVLAGLR